MGVHVPQCAWWCVCVVMFAFVSSTSAQSERLVVRASADAATMISRDQLNHLA